jgi:hypothetical protein
MELERIAHQIKQGERSPEVLKNAREELGRLRKTGSRLVAVDAGSEPSRLRQLYPDRHRFIVLPAEVSLQYVPQASDKARSHPAYLYGRISELSRPEIHVPMTHRSLLERIRKEEQQSVRASRFSSRWEKDQEPRYSVVVSYGKRLEPWIVDVQPLPLPRQQNIQNRS